MTFEFTGDPETKPFHPDDDDDDEERDKILAKYQPHIDAQFKVLEEIGDDDEGASGDIAKAFLEYLAHMAGKTIDILEEDKLVQKSLTPESTKADVPSKRRLRQALRNAGEEFDETWFDAYTRGLSDSVELGYSQQLDLVFNAPTRSEVETLRARDENKRRLILESRAIDSFDQINKTTTERIMKQITEGVDNGETIDQIAARIGEFVGEEGTTLSKARTIARTETLTAVSVGQNAAMQNAKEIIPGMEKMWVSADDDRVRDSHVDVDGERVSVDEEFSNGLKYPREPGAPADEVINCRCTILMIAPEDQ